MNFDFMLFFERSTAFRSIDVVPFFAFVHNFWNLSLDFFPSAAAVASTAAQSAAAASTAGGETGGGGLQVALPCAVRTPAFLWLLSQRI